MVVPITTTAVRLVRDADGAACQGCGVFFTKTNPYWHWRKSQAMHEKLSGHKMVLFKYD